MSRNVFVRTGLVSAALAVVLGGANAANPILGTFTGLWGYHIETRIDGELDPGGTGDQASQQTMTFAPAHAGTLSGFEATWKKANGRYTLDASEAAQEFLASQTSDPSAKTKLVNRAIRLENGGTITGRMLQSQRFHMLGSLIKRKLKGPYLGVKDGPT